MVFTRKNPVESEESANTEASGRFRKKSPSRKRPTSPARNKSPGRRSPGRPRAPSPPAPKSSTPKVAVLNARSPIRRSPARKSPTRTTSPSRKTPTRTTKVVSQSVETVSSEMVTRPRRTNTKLVEVDSDSDNTDGDVLGYLDKPHAAVKGRARRLEVQVEKLNLKAEPRSTFNIIKQIAQNSQRREVERVVHLKNVDNVAQKLGEFSDEDETALFRKSVSAERVGDFRQITEFGGPWGALLYIFIIPLYTIALLISCNESQCSLVKLPDFKKYLSVSAFLDLPSTLGFIGFAVLLALISVIPFGGKLVKGMATKQGKYTYIMNGLFSTVVLASILIGLEVRKIPITEFISKHLLHLLVASIWVGLILAIYAYVRSFYVPFSHLNGQVVGRNKIYGFFMGRELNPRAFGLLDLKMYVFRLALIATILLDFSLLNATLNWTPILSFDYKNIQANSTLLVLVAMHTIYCLDALAHESAFVSSFEIQYEGFGYMGAVGYLVWPFWMASVTKYVVDYNVRLPLWQLILVCLVFTFGYILFRGSNNQKDAFRKNPYDPALSQLETIPTSKGKKLLCSGFWGVVRHPNYLGDILMNLVLIPFAPDVPPVLCSFGIVILLIHRSVRDNTRCKQKYGPAWDRYCNKVKYVLLPKVY